jgi:hypothetical protein
MRLAEKLDWKGLTNISCHINMVHHWNNMKMNGM